MQRTKKRGRVDLSKLYAGKLNYKEEPDDDKKPKKTTAPSKEQETVKVEQPYSKTVARVEDFIPTAGGLLDAAVALVVPTLLARQYRDEFRHPVARMAAGAAAGLINAGARHVLDYVDQPLQLEKPEKKERETQKIFKPASKHADLAALAGVVGGLGHPAAVIPYGLTWGIMSILHDNEAAHKQLEQAAHKAYDEKKSLIIEAPAAKIQGVKKYLAETPYANHVFELDDTHVQFDPIVRPTNGTSTLQDKPK